MSAADTGADQRAMKSLQVKVATLEAHVDALITANMGREALITDGRERADRQDAEIAKLQGRVDALAGRIIALENPLAAAHRGLSEATAKLPHYAERLTQAEVAERASEKESSQ